MREIEAICRVLCKQADGNPNERVDYNASGRRWEDYVIEARQILRAVRRVQKLRRDRLAKRK